MADGPNHDATAGNVEVERLRLLFRTFAATQCRGRSAVYETLSERVADDDQLLGLLRAAPPGQQRPSLLLAAVNLLLAARPDSALAAYYPIHGGSRPADGRLPPVFTAFCAEHRQELGHLLRDRPTQTNEIRRCVALYLGLAHVRRRWPGPVALLEAGASAGLNLYFDRYRYRLNGQDTAPAATSRITISCQVRGQVDDLTTLRDAMDLAAAAPIAPVVQADAATDTARLIDDMPGRDPVAVFSASLLSYLTAEGLAAFAGQLRHAATRRPVAWIFAEAPGLVARAGLDIAALRGPLARRNTVYLVGASLRGFGRDDDVVLALADPYLRWLAPARHPADDFEWVSRERP